MLDALEKIALKIREIKKNTHDIEKLAELNKLIKVFNDISSRSGLEKQYPEALVKEAEQVILRAKQQKKSEIRSDDKASWVTDSFYCQQCDSIELSTFQATKTSLISEQGFDTCSFSVPRTRVCENCGFTYRTQETLILNGDTKTRAARQVPHLNYDTINSLESARGFIRKSVYWINHSSGGDVLCPGFSERVYKGISGFEIDFGANKLLITVLFKRVIDELNRVLSGETSELTDDWIDLIIRGAVANHKGIEYSTYYPIIDGCYLKFGNHGIDIDNARGFIFTHPKLTQFFDTEAYKLAASVA